MRRLLVTSTFVGILSLAVVSESLAGGGLWTGGGQPDQLWTSDANWEAGAPPEAGFGGIVDDAFITFQGSGATEGPIIQDGIDAIAGQVILGWAGFVNNPGDTVTMTMTGGTLTTQTEFWIGKNDSSFGNHNPLTSPGIFNISGGEVTLGPVGQFVVGQGAEGTVNQTGGTVTAFRLVLDWYNETGSVPSTYNLHGGTLQVNDTTEFAPIVLGTVGGIETQGLIDITEGVMKLAGDITASVLELIAANNLTAYGGSGTVRYDFDTTNPGLTTVWAEMASADDADFDGNSSVDGADFLIWQRGFGIPVGGGATLGDGDANGDGGVNELDLGVWQTQFGTTLPITAIFAIPEPATALLLGIGGLLCFVRCRRR